ncbi:AfsR/SARP family transcriptional regulator [Actinomadura macrotermitis]|uniref:Bacterial transcriptional activator domain-containing protein n=1 Tax=Actinomadura macrotermitis TaxID=2585200 RepID=A0A7K0BWX4_9ACTN|nr:bacterial transcriptional activator domain-containing protein [Actinomadura macrotermitis]MQY05681.1 hypothetical protein [Actinomadura macrotermitis]
MHGDTGNVGSDNVRLEFLPSFRCRVGAAQVRFPQALCSLIVTVALEPGGLSRASLQGRLWPGLPLREAAKRLRQALWRIRRETGGRVLEVSPTHVALAANVTVDIREAEHIAQRAVNGMFAGMDPPDPEPLTRELLSDWPCEAVHAAQDRWDRLRLHAMERIAEHLHASGNVPGALELLEVATRVDELGETAHRLMAAAHLARGDQVSAWRVYLRYQRLLRDEIGLEPSADFQGLFKHLAERSLVS